MKAGAYLAYTAFRQLSRQAADAARHHADDLSDEEIGSPTSRALIEAEGRRQIVLVTEPARDGGKIVTGRKGVGRFEVFSRAYSPIRSRPKTDAALSASSATSSHARWAERSAARRQRHVGVIRGGTKPNVVAEHAYTEVDLRVKTAADAEELIAKI